jgi:UDP-2-acetamido-3-amino-2,3-dideoxy-glucuronate N-acetyltransferase
MRERQWFEDDGNWLPNVSHIDPRARLGNDVWVGRFCIIEKDCNVGDLTRIGDFCKLMPGTVIGADCRIDDYANTSGAVVLGNGVMVKRQACVTQGLIAYEKAFIGPGVMVIHEQHVTWGRPGLRKMSRGIMLGVGAVVGGQALLLPGVEIGNNAWVAAGAVVTKDCDAGGIYVGAPAKKVGEVPEEYLVEVAGRRTPLRFAPEVLEQYLPDLVAVGRVELR